jgi:tRNA/rRNA methyltransferase
MANFGLSHLAVVAPYEPHWREARSAVGAPQLLADARQTQTLAEAIAGCTLVLGTGTLTHRKPEQLVVQLPDLAPLVASELEHGGRVALIFGPEKHGLTRDDLSYCHLLVEIPTDRRQPSMNLGQAVAVCLYELASRVQSCPVQAANIGVSPHVDPACGAAADAETLELVAGLVDQVMEAAHYSPAAMREANRHDLRLMLRRLAPDKKDARRILGLFRRILWRLKR